MPGLKYVVAGFVTLILALGLYLGYERYDERYAIEREDNLAVSKVVTAAFAKQGSLRVGTLSGIVQSAAADSRGFGLLKSDQVMKAPYSVDYHVDLSRLSTNDYAWNSEKHTLVIRVPEVVVGQANVDESKMTMVRSRGVFITREAFDVLRRGTSSRAQKLAQAKAGEPEQIAKARDNAKSALSSLLGGPLAVAGMSDVKVVVIFPTDGTGTNERWDESRSVANVLAQAR